MKIGRVMRRLDWMDPADTRILEFLAEENAELSAEEIADALHYRPDYIRDRCSVLAEQGLVQPVDQESTVYFVRELGLDFVNGEVSPEGLETPASVSQ